ncbi:MAG: hypothetical protein ACTSYD_08750 [Candidatus Heimdallarchaeaceae archaeon]
MTTVSSNSQESVNTIKIETHQTTVITPKQLNFGNWYEILAKNIMVELEKKSQETLLDYQYPVDLLEFAELLVDANNWDQLALPTKVDLVKVIVPKLANYLHTSYNGSITLLKAIFSFKYEFYIDKSFVYAFRILQIINKTKSIIKPNLYCDFSFSKLVNLTLNGLFIRQIDNEIRIGTYGFSNPMTQLPDLISRGLLYYLPYSPYYKDIEEAIGNTLLFLGNKTTFKGDWPYDWPHSAHLAIMMRKFGEITQNSTCILESGQLLQELFSEKYYENDSILFSFKLKVAEELIPFNLSYAESIVNAVTHTFCNTPWGLQPIICATDQNSRDLLKKGGECLGFIDATHFKVFESLAQRTGNETYHSLLKDILRFYLTELYFDQETGQWIEGYESYFEVNSTNEYSFFIAKTYTHLIYQLVQLLNSLPLNEYIKDLTPPNATISYDITHMGHFNTRQESYRLINETIILNCTKNRYLNEYPLLFIRADVSDIGLGYKNVSILKENETILKDRYYFSDRHPFYHDIWPTPFAPVKRLAMRSIFIPIKLPFNETQEYCINILDKNGNLLKIEINVSNVTKEAPIDLFVSTLLLMALAVKRFLVKKKVNKKV